MRYIPQNVLELGDNYNKPLEHIEECARICYKSEDKIKEGSAKKMIGALARNGHTSTFEHFIVAVKVDRDRFLHLASTSWNNQEVTRYLKYDWDNCIISGNLRAWRQVQYILGYFFLCYAIAREYDCFEIFDKFEYNELKIKGREHILDTVKVLRYEELPLEHKWFTFKITTDRAIANEIERHRKFGYSQESTRYCNYGGIDISFCEPESLEFCEQVEREYHRLIINGVKPEDARDVLPLCTKTEFAMTGYLDDFKWFIDVRGHDKYGKAHHKVKEIALWIEDIINNKEI